MIFIPKIVYDEVKAYDGFCFPNERTYTCRVKTNNNCYTYTIYPQNGYDFNRSQQSSAQSTCYTSYNTQYPKYQINQLSDNPIYRNDFSQILLLFVLMVLVIFYVPNKIFFRLFRRLR